MTEGPWRTLLRVPRKERVTDSLGRVWQFDLENQGFRQGVHWSGWHCPEAGISKQYGDLMAHLGPFHKIEGEEMPSRLSLTKQVAELEAQLAKAREALSDAKPDLPRHAGAVIKFWKFDYEWAAIKVLRNGELLWFVTQDGTRSARQGIRPMNDDDFLTWVYESNWDSIEYMV